MLDFDTRGVGAFFRERVSGYSFKTAVFEYGTVESCADGVVHVKGLYGSRYGEILEFENDCYGLALDLRLDGVGAVLLSGTSSVTAGSIVKGTGHLADIGVGYNMLGRVVDAIGRPLDGKPLEVEEYRRVEGAAPTIIQRAPVDTPLETGLMAVDSMIPIGRGQRELIIGDRQTGKTTVALSAMLNQKGKRVICIYCSIGQKASTIAQVVSTLEAASAMEHTVVVGSTASDSPAMQYLAPYAACAIAEHFMYMGRDTLVVYDDLSKHAVAYRAMSLLLRRPSGREAYPGDVFYLHSRLLERAAKLNAELGGGSMTALPIVETMAGDISAYIPTNVISITDGQIYLETELFNSGVRPAVNVGLSVSRVGRAAQHNAMKEVSKSMRLEIAQYREMAIFAQFGSDIDTATKQQLMKGERLIELTKQNQSEIMSLAEQVVVLIAYMKGVFMEVATEQVRGYKQELLGYIMNRCKRDMTIINNSGNMTESERYEIEAAIEEYAEARKAKEQTEMD